MGSLNTRDSTTEVQPCELYSSDFHSEEIGVVPVEPYGDAFENICTSPTLTNASNYNISFPSNTWASGTPARLESQFVGNVYLAPIPTHCITAPFTSSDGVDPTASNGWQFDASSFIQMNSGMPWWGGPWASPGSHDQTTFSSRLLKTGNLDTHKQKPESISISEATTDGRQHGNRTDSVSQPRENKNCDGPGPCQETSIKSHASALTVAIMYSDPATSPIPFTPDASFDLPETDAQTTPRQSRSSRKASSSNEKRRTKQSPTPETSQSEQRARNRKAANKCRIKTKAAVAELEATEREESSRHEQLSMTLRSLQADVFVLKSEILMHGNCGDWLIQDYLKKSARSLTAGCVGSGEGGSGGGSPISSSRSLQSRR